MAVIIDENFDSVLLDTTNKAVISENFTYLIKQLMDYVDPAVSNEHEKLSHVIGGKRRAMRGERSSKLGYSYRIAAGKLITKSGKSKVINAFGTNILVDEWTVSHPHVVDSNMGEEYPTVDSNGEPRGPYTCLMTARISLTKKTPTRCYVSCNCKDFDTKFYERLQQGGYTKEKSLPKATQPERLAPALCKHLYAIYIQHYRDLVKETENFVVDSSPVLFGGTDTNTGPQNPIPTTITSPTTTVNKVATNKQEAIDIITAYLKTEYNRIKDNPDAYFDTRTAANGGQTYHRYPFSVILQNGNLKAIAYRNKNMPLTKANNSPIQILNIPNNPKIWRFMKFGTDHIKLWNIIKSLGEMPANVKAKLKASGKKEPVFDNVEIITDLSYLAENDKSSILSSISELN